MQVIDRVSGKLVAELPSGEDPEQFFLSRDGGTLFVANENDAALTAIDLSSRTVAFQVAVGGEPEGVAQSPDERWVAVTSEEDNVVTWIDLSTRTAAGETATEMRPRHVEFTADGRQLWIAAEIRDGTTTGFCLGEKLPCVVAAAAAPQLQRFQNPSSPRPCLPRPQTLWSLLEDDPRCCAPMH